MSNLSDFINKFEVKSLSIHETPFWTWSLRPTQPTLGASVISLNHEASLLSDLHANESADLVKILALAQNRMLDRLLCQKVNIMMLMHFDTHLHFHVLPRYSKEQRMFGVDWKDTGWPGFPNGMSPGESIVADAIRREIIAHLAS
jgi:diadenosine tetraphosphate (Ap4A) HIT family hydrolase